MLWHVFCSGKSTPIASLLSLYFYCISCYFYMNILNRLYLLCYLPSSFQTAFFSRAVKLNGHIFSTQRQQHRGIVFDLDLHINYSYTHIYTHHDKNDNSYLNCSCYYRSYLEIREQLLRRRIFISVSTSE